MMKKILILVLSVTFVLAFSPALTAFGEKPPGYFVDEAQLPFDAIPGIDTTRYWGIHNNAGYRMEVPANWNGSLVLWAHGYRGDGLELTVDDPPIREFLVASGFAWAASSYSQNSYNVAQGAKDTHALGEFFSDQVGEPNRVYVTGASMGGHITAVMIEQWKNEYDGALPACGVLGDHELFDFFLDFNLVAQALAGIQAEFPAPSDYMFVTVPAIKASLELFPGTFPFTLNAQGQALMAVTMLQSGGPRPVFNQGFFFWNGFAGDFLFSFGMLDGTVPNSPGVVVGNMDTVYQFDLDPALTPAELALNESVLRVSEEPQGRVPKGLANVPVVDGDIRIPVLTLHTLGDLFVPFSMEQIYAQRVAEQGASDLLVQRAIRDFGHCSFTAEELIGGFVDLVNWVEFGVKPAGDDVLDMAAVADPNFGCTFTSDDRQFPPPLSIPACP
jgi:acetyl esterase/lipase